MSDKKEKVNSKNSTNSNKITEKIAPSTAPLQESDSNPEEGHTQLESSAQSGETPEPSEAQAPPLGGGLSDDKGETGEEFGGEDSSKTAGKGEEEPHRAGIVALVGRPNVGKSTLMNRLVGDKVSIATPLAQTTRNQIRGIQNLPNAQIVYIDTPGIHRAQKALNRYMVEAALNALEGVDLILYIVDATRPDPAVLPAEDDQKKQFTPGYKEDLFILEKLSQLDPPIFLVVNKIDLVDEKVKLLPLIDHYTEKLSFEEVIPISAVTGDGIDILLEEIVKRLPVSPPLFPQEIYTDMAERFLVAEIIREKLILNTKQEIPYSTAVIIEEFDESERYPDGEGGEDAGEGEAPEEAGGAEGSEAEQTSKKRRRKGLIRISATILVERDSQKAIVIGKRGQRLKKIGTEARLELEKLLDAKVFLQLWVKVSKNWSQNESLLERLGYSRKNFL